MKLFTRSLPCAARIWLLIFWGLAVLRLPAEIQVNSITANLVTVHFDQPIDPASAGETINYGVFSKQATGGSTLSITNAVVQSDQQTVALYLNNPVSEFYAIGVNGVAGTNNNLISATNTGVLGDLTSTLIATNGDPTAAGDVVPFFNDTFNLSANGSDIGGTADHGQFINQKNNGDFEMIVQVTRLDNTDSQAKAGLMAREDLTPGSRMVGIFCTPVINGTGCTIQIAIRSTAGATAFTNLTASVSGLRWLRITRTNTTLTTFYGTDGLNWTTLGGITSNFSNTLYVGAAATSHKVGVNTTAGFANFGVFGTKPGAGIIPIPAISIYQRTNLVISWQRTPLDYCPQATTSLLGNTNSSQNISNATQWAYVLYPVFDTSITGTNAAQPTPARYMIIPMSLVTNQALFIRLARVERLIPDPISVTPGLILSQASGSMVTTSPSGSTIGGTQIDTSTALAQNSVPVLCPVGHTYQFTTAPSASSLQVCLLVRNFPAAGTSTSDGSFTAGSYKSQVTLTPVSPNTGYTFVAAATPAVKPSACNPIRVQINIK
ncbi:MAG TPA: hypothetical protein VF607_13745 [Verrucomicrobiae bacterium]